MVDNTGDFRESLSDAQITGHTRRDSGELTIELMLWNQEPATLTFSRPAAVEPEPQEIPTGTVIEYLDEYPEDEFFRKASASSGSDSLRNYVLIDFDSKAVLRVAAADVDFRTDSPLLNEKFGAA